MRARTRPDPSSQPDSGVVPPGVRGTSWPRHSPGAVPPRGDDDQGSRRKLRPNRRPVVSPYPIEGQQQREFRPIQDPVAWVRVLKSYQSFMSNSARKRIIR